ncbi:MAG: hypothetical protein HYV60_21115 [Planctomycetia bacterium]|nr:hypothetical protein [Planctomycetia bacterium]
MAIKTVPSATPLGVCEPVLIVFLVVAIVANFALQLLVAKLAFTDSGLRHLGELTRLQVLLLQSTKFQGDGFASFSDMPQLAVVQLSASHCGDGVTHLVSHAPALYELSLDRTAVTDAVMSVLQEQRTRK